MTNEIINSELLNEEQLDRVSGGTATETAKDSHFFSSLGGFTGYYDIWTVADGSHDAEIRNAWAKVGVEAIIVSPDREVVVNEALSVLFSIWGKLHSVIP